MRRCFVFFVPCFASASVEKRRSMERCPSARPLLLPLSPGTHARWVVAFKSRYLAKARGKKKAESNKRAGVERKPHRAARFRGRKYEKSFNRLSASILRRLAAALPFAPLSRFPRASLRTVRKDCTMSIETRKGGALQGKTRAGKVRRKRENAPSWGQQRSSWKTAQSP